MLFVIALAPLSTLHFVWLGLLAAQVYLLTKDLRWSLLDMLLQRAK